MLANLLLGVLLMSNTLTPEDLAAPGTGPIGDPPTTAPPPPLRVNDVPPVDTGIYYPGQSMKLPGGGMADPSLTVDPNTGALIDPATGQIISAPSAGTPPPPPPPDSAVPPSTTDSPYTGPPTGQTVPPLPPPPPAMTPIGTPAPAAPTTVDPTTAPAPATGPAAPAPPDPTGYHPAPPVGTPGDPGAPGAGPAASSSFGSGPGFPLPSSPGNANGFQAIPQWITEGLAQSPYARSLMNAHAGLLGDRALGGFRDDPMLPTNDADSIMRRGLGGRAPTAATDSGALPPWATGQF